MRLSFSRCPFPKRLASVALVLLILGAAAAFVGLTGCKKGGAAPKIEPKVKPPAIAEAGVLRAGIDLTYPPFGGEDKGKQAGIDVDVAQALAADLGLTLRIVSTPASDAVAALAGGTVDMMLSVPITASTVSGAAVVGSYISDGPAFFTTTVETVTVETIGSRTIAAQTSSPAFWALESALGPDVVQEYPDLRAALGALADDKVAIVAGDALVGAYIARDFPSVRFSGQLGLGQRLAVAVSKDNTELADAVRASLDTLAADGVLRTVRAKWVGDVPDLQVPKQ